MLQKHCLLSIDRQCHQKFDDFTDKLRVDHAADQTQHFMPAFILVMGTKDFLFQKFQIDGSFFFKLPDKFPGAEIFQKCAVNKGIVISPKKAQNEVANPQLVNDANCRRVGIVNA